MNVIFDPDKEFTNILSENKVDKAIEFIKVESRNMIKLKQLISSCNTDEQFEQILPKMLECIQHIRSAKINLIYNYFKFYQIHKKNYINKLRQSIKR